MNEHELAPIVAAVFPSASIGRCVPLRGGLEAAVARVTLHGAGDVVVKRLTHGLRREAARYRALVTTGVAPALLGAVDDGDRTYLLLERVRPASTWPWRDSDNTRRVLEQLARVHRIGAAAPHPDDWDYEEELRNSAAETVGAARWLAAALPEIRRELRPLWRVAAALAEARERMRAGLGTTLIHGDLHSGNVVFRSPERGGVVFLDWARSRTGSPLEDVSSWLLSLRAWEPAAGRDHDSLLRTYLAAAGLPLELTPELRDAYWFAAASNALAGALRYHLAAATQGGPRTRAKAIVQAKAALRVMRRADERLRRG